MTKMKTLIDPEYVGRPFKHSSTAMTIKSEPKVLFTREAIKKQERLIRAFKTEVGWLGMVRPIQDLVYEVYDIILPKQQVHGSTTEIDAGAWADLIDELEEQGLDTEQRFWGHKTLTA